MNRDQTSTQSLVQHLREPQHQWPTIPPCRLDERMGQVREVGGGGAWTAVFVVCSSPSRVVRIGWQSRRQPGRVALLSLLSSALSSRAESSPGISLTQLEQLALEHLPEVLEVIPAERLEEARQVLRLIQRAGRRCDTHPPVPADTLEEPLCHCWGVGRGELEAVLRAGQSLRAAQHLLGIGSSCGACGPAVLEVARGMGRENPFSSS